MVDEEMAAQVEKWGVGSATELEWGFQYPLAYFLVLLWLYPVSCILRSGENAKSDLLVSFLPLVLLIVTGSVFGTNLGPFLCLLGAFALICGAAKYHQPSESSFAAIGSVLLPARLPKEGEEDGETSEHQYEKEVYNSCCLLM